MTLPDVVSSSIFVGLGHIGHVYDIVAVEQEQAALSQAAIVGVW